MSHPPLFLQLIPNKLKMIYFRKLLLNNKEEQSELAEGLGLWDLNPLLYFTSYVITGDSLL